ncbi:cytosolic carboxypeptidase 2-like, partial [Ruditapes philippinarum]|uniref:cytosolic carboxypeptidase 2-like n=1 Tax=Ruditapes philippinarum TaxID=129788 RepID=UPI00295B455B
MIEQDKDAGYQYQNPYDSFMRKHLQHYGYYTGRNQGYRSTFQSYAEWEKNFPYMSVSESSESDDSDSDDKKDNKLQDQIQKTTQLVFVEKDGKAVAQLKAPINSLFPRELGPQQAARWPADIQVIDRRIKHIPYVPNEPEAFYKITGLEKTPMVRGEERGGRLVF